MYPEDILEKVQEIEKTAITITSEKDEKKINLEKINFRKKIKEFFKDLSIIEDKSELRVKNEVIELLQMLNRKYSFDSIFNSDLDFSLQFLYLKAHLFQKVWDLEELSKILENVEKLFESKYNFTKSDFYLTEVEKTKKFVHILTPRFFVRLNYMVIYIETLLQHTAVLSQIDDNENALKKANLCHEVFRSYFLILDRIFEILSAIGPENVSLFNFQNDMIFHKILEFLNIMRSSKFPVLEEVENNLVSNLSNWDLMKNNNEKYIIKQLQSKSENNFKINTDWISNFHISNIVKLNNFETFQEKLLNPVIDQNFILRTFLIYACCVFSIAAENRFISNKEIFTESELQKEQKTKSNNQKYMEEVSKELRLQKNKRFVLSEKIHLKALETILFAFNEEIKLFKHFLHSYKKNYTFNILAIEEVEEPSVTTLNNSEYFENDFLHKQNETNYEEIDRLNEKLSKLVSKKNFKKSKNSKSPLKLKKNFLQQLKLDTRDLSPQFYKNLNTKFLKKDNGKKQSSISNKKYLSKKNDKTDSQKVLSKNIFKNDISKSKEKNNSKKNVSLTKNIEKSLKDLKMPKSKLQELITEINQNSFNSVDLGNKELNLKYQNFFQKNAN